MDFRRAAIVVAHPDDEILWFSSLAAKVGRIVMCYGAVSNVPERAAQRRRLVEAYPLDTVQFFDLPQPAFWRGMSPGAFERATVELAEENPGHRLALADRLRTALQGVDTVFVHNPWGEYGHEDHRRLNAVVNALRDEMKFKVYVSAYVEMQILNQVDGMLADGIGDVISFPTDRAEIEPIVAMYKLHSCWTWAENWRWPKEEHFFRVGEGVRIREASIPFQVFDVRW